MAKGQPHPFKDTTHTLHLNFLFATHLEALLGDLFAKLENAFNQCLGTRRTARDIDINRDNGIDALNRIIAIIELATGVGAPPHTENPLRLRHLLPEETETRSHFD